MKKLCAVFLCLSVACSSKNAQVGLAQNEFALPQLTFTGDKTETTVFFNGYGVDPDAVTGVCDGRMTLEFRLEPDPQWRTGAEIATKSPLWGMDYDCTDQGFRVRPTWLDLNPNSATPTIDANFVRKFFIRGQTVLGATPEISISYVYQKTPPSVDFDGAMSEVLENVPASVVRLTLTQPARLEVKVAYAVLGTATAGADHELVTGVVTFPSGSTVATIYVPIIDDTSVEGPETVELIMGTPINAGLGEFQRHVLTIKDDD